MKFMKNALVAIGFVIFALLVVNAIVGIDGMPDATSFVGPILA